MSIGPTHKEENLKPGIPTRTQLVIRKTLSAFFEEPLHYIFYSSLVAILVGLFLNKRFPWQLYVVILILAAIKVYRFYKPMVTNVINEPAAKSK